MKKQQSGFTMIELIMVIVILGILSAVALPKFADFTSSAKKAALDGALASIKSASMIAHSSYLVNGVVASTTVTIEGTDVTLSNGYPTADVNGICKAAGIDGNADFQCTGTVVHLKGAVAGDDCISYTAATITNNVITAPIIVKRAGKLASPGSSATCSA